MEWTWKDALAFLAAVYLIAFALSLHGCTTAYRAVAPPSLTDHDKRRVDAYCQIYRDPEPCYLAAGYVIEPVKKEVAKVEWQTTF
jgi:hypothetical protein